MSGICGILYLDGRTVEEESLRRMTDVVAHRGPDGIGHWVNGPVGLGHLQLCTTPESLIERQPLATPDSNYTIVWDGRLDNREELIQGLRSRGPIDAASPDSELVLQSYIVWGEECVKRILGDFAFAVWDGVNQQLFCARDPIGMRLFNYYFDGRQFIFGTEIKQIFQRQDVPRRVNELMVGLYLCGNFGDGEMSFYHDIHRLPGGYSLRVSRDGLAKSRFWDPDPYNTISFSSEMDYAERFQELIFEAVRCRMRSNTGVEICLSGGVDSGSVAAVAGTLISKGAVTDVSLSAQTVVYRNPPLDETPYVRLIAEQYGIPVTWLSANECWAMKPTPGNTHMDEPLKLHFEAMHHAALESMRERGIRVALTGEGGDETSMLGPSLIYIQEWLRDFQWQRLWRDFRNGTPGYRQDVIEVGRRWLVPRWARRLTGHDGVSIPPWVSPDFAQKYELAHWLQRLEIRSRRDGHYLQQRGRNIVVSGGELRQAEHNVEWRHPFYDSRIVEFLVRIPPEVRFRGGRNKVLLREAMSGTLMEPLRLRGPHGAFQGLLDRGLREKESDRLLDLLKDSRLVQMGAIDSNPLAERFQSYLHGNDASLAKTLLTFLTEEWLRQPQMLAS